MTPEQRARLEELCSLNRELNDDELAEFNELRAAFDEEREQRSKVAEERAELLAALRSTDGQALQVEVAQTEPGDDQRRDAGFQIQKRNDPYDLTTLTPYASRSELRSRAMTAIEQTSHTDDSAKEAAVATLSNVREDPTGIVAKRMLATGTEEYRSAFAKIMANRQYAVTPEESIAVERAASLTDASGGFAIPFTLDPSIILTNVGAVSPMRQICRVVQIATDSWQGITSAGVTASYAAEASEVDDDAPTLAQPAIPVHRADAFVPYSFEIGMDWPGMQADLAMMFADARDRLEATAFVTGSGSDAPTGIETELAGGGSIVATATAEVLALADFGEVYAQVPARHRNSRLAAIAEWSTLVEVRRILAAAGDRSSYNEATATQPSTLFGWPIYESSAMDAFSDVNVAATATHHLICVGDWTNYVIVDRVGMNVEPVPHLFATGNNRPSGQRGVLAWWRNGGESVNDDAFRMLTLTTTA